jgi:hypothetical protein
VNRSAVVVPDDVFQRDAPHAEGRTSSRGRRARHRPQRLGPFGAPYKKFGVYNTEYRTVADLTNKRYFFELSTRPNVIWIDLAKLNLAPDASVMVLAPDDVGLSGEVSEKLKPAAAPF